MSTDEEAVTCVPTAEVVRVYRLLGELNAFLHQPLNYGEDSAVSRWLDAGVYAELRQVYYSVAWNWLPPSEKREIEQE